jgi:hypothetical protein
VNVDLRAPSISIVLCANAAPHARWVLAGYTRWALPRKSRTLLAAVDSAGSGPADGTTSNGMFSTRSCRHYHHIQAIVFRI